MTTDISIDDYDADEYADNVPAAPKRAKASKPKKAKAAGPKLPGNREERRAAARKSTAVEREANGITVARIEYDGETYWVPADVLDWDPEAMMAFENQKAMKFLQGILEPDEDGRDGFAHLMEVKRRKGYRMRQLNELYEEIAKALGFVSAGN
ncbi:hypothetical protein [Gordonia malaquae]|uniref:hypothetical protein n=1 Tax=Gordonia malaquae TaxID=410332 RepID=UPI003019AAF3